MHNTSLSAPQMCAACCTLRRFSSVETDARVVEQLRTHTSHVHAHRWRNSVAHKKLINSRVHLAFCCQLYSSGSPNITTITQMPRVTKCHGWLQFRSQMLQEEGASALTRRRAICRPHELHGYCLRVFVHHDPACGGVGSRPLSLACGKNGSYPCRAGAAVMEWNG